MYNDYKELSDEQYRELKALVSAEKEASKAKFLMTAEEARWKFAECSETSFTETEYNRFADQEEYE